MGYAARRIKHARAAAVPSWVQRIVPLSPPRSRRSEDRLMFVSTASCWILNGQDTRRSPRVKGAASSSADTNLKSNSVAAHNELVPTAFERLVTPAWPPRRFQCAGDCGHLFRFSTTCYTICDAAACRNRLKTRASARSAGWSVVSPWPTPLTRESFKALGERIDARRTGRGSHPRQTALHRCSLVRVFGAVRC